MDSNWNWQSSTGQWALNSPDALTQEVNFQIDANGDGIIGYLPIEAQGNTKLLKDATDKYFVQTVNNTPLPIKNGGQQIYKAIYSSDWQTLAVETVNGQNQVLWKNISGNFLHIWKLDSNWNWQSSTGQWALNSPDALIQEANFQVDANGDGIIGYLPIEAQGNTKLLKDATDKYFVQTVNNTPLPIKNGGQQIYKDIYGSNWQTLALETVNGQNQVLWKNVSGNFLHIWKLDSNWNWQSSTGQWALNSPDALIQEVNFQVDANGDGIIGYLPIEANGNTKLLKDATEKYFVQTVNNTPLPIKINDQQIYKNIYSSDWQTLAIETVNGQNQVLWKNVSGNFLHLWKLDSNWNWTASEGAWALNSLEAFTQESNFQQDFNGDGLIGYVKPSITIIANDADAGEPNNSGQFTFTRSGNYSQNLTVSYTVAGTATNGTDYSNLVGNVTFAAGSSTALININPIDDSVYEGNETVILTLAANSNYSIGNPNSAVVIITDDDPMPYITVTSPNGGESWQAGSSYNLTWTDNISENVKVDLYKAGIYQSTLLSSTLSDGSETVMLSSSLAAGTDY